MKVLLTGCNSFIGQELMKSFDDNQINFIGIDLTKNDRDNCIECDINNREIEKIVSNDIIKQDVLLFFTNVFIKQSFSNAIK